MPTGLRSLESPRSLPSLHPPVPLSPRLGGGKEMEAAVLAPALADTFSVPAAPYRDPTPAQRAAQLSWQMGATAVDLTFGTHWAIQQHLRSRDYLKRTAGDKQQITWLLHHDPLLTDASSATFANVHKNAQAWTRHRGHGRIAAFVRKYCYGDAIVAGGLPYGAGITIGPQFSGGGITTGLTAASYPLLYVGAPVLAAAALGIAAHEGVRYRRATKLSKSAWRAQKHAVMGNEARVHVLLTTRLRNKRIHASTKSTALIGHAIGAPLLILGLGPGLAVLAPAALALFWAWQHHHNHLRYKPSLSPAESLMLGGKRDIINRVDLTHQTRATLKELKAQKRLIYPRGGQGLLGLRETAQSLAWIRRRWQGVPKDYPAPRETVFKFLQALANHEVDFVRHQEKLQHYEMVKMHRLLTTAPGDASKRHRELSAQRLALLGWLSERTDECRTLNFYGQTPPAKTVIVHLFAFLQRYGLSDRFMRKAVLQHARVKHRLLQQGALTQDAKNFHLEVGQVARWMSTDVSLPEDDHAQLADDLCQIAERYLLEQEKKRLTFFERELLDMLAYRLDNAQSVRPQVALAARFGQDKTQKRVA